MDLICPQNVMIWGFSFQFFLGFSFMGNIGEKIFTLDNSLLEQDHQHFYFL